MKKRKHSLFIWIASGTVLLCLILFLVPFFWGAPVFMLLKSDLFSGYTKAGIIRLYRPASPQIIREHVHLYNGGVRPVTFRPGPVLIPGKGYNYTDSLGLILSKAFYEEARPFDNGLALVMEHSLYGMINRRGHWVVRPAYDTLITFSGIIIGVRGNEHVVTDRKGHIKIPLSPGSITFIYNGKRIPFLVRSLPDDSFEVIDGRGTHKGGGPYDTLVLRDDSFFVRRKGLWGALDGDGTLVIPVVYDSIGRYQPDLYTVRKNGMEGLHLPGHTEPLIPVRYEKADVCTPSTYRVLLDGHYGLLDKNAGSLIEPVYDTIYFHHDREWIVTGDHGRYALRHTRNLEYPSEFFDYIGPCREGMTIVRNGNGYGVLSEKGEVVVTPQYDSIRNYSHRVAVVYHNEQYGVVDDKGAFTIPFSLKLVEIYDFSDDMALAAQLNMMSTRIRKQYGFIDKKGNTVIPFVYEDGHRLFSNGLAGVRFNGSWGFIDRSGKRIIPFLYDTVSVFSHGKSQVVYHGQILTIDTQGRILK